MDERPAEATDRASVRVLLIAVFTIATCGLVYELLSGTIASYLLGDSVCLLYTSPSPRDGLLSRMPSSA